MRENWLPVLRFLGDFASRLIAGFIGTFMAGLLLLLIARMYVSWEVERFRESLQRAAPPQVVVPPPMIFEPPPLIK